MLNPDVIFYISTFLTLPEYLQASSACREFVDIKILRLKRKQWCIQRCTVPTIKPGRCSNVECGRQKLYCIYLKPLEKNIVSLYCGPCTIKFKNINTVLLL